MSDSHDPDLHYQSGKPVEYWEEQHKIAIAEQMTTKPFLVGTGAIVVGAVILLATWLAVNYIRINFVWGWIIGVIAILGGFFLLFQGRSLNASMQSDVDKAQANLERARQENTIGGSSASSDNS